jgi:hypothetical protein
MPVGRRRPPGRRRGRPLSRTQWEPGCRGGQVRIGPMSRIHGPAWSESGWFNGTPGSGSPTPGPPGPAARRAQGPGPPAWCSRMCLQRSAGGGPGCWSPGGVGVHPAFPRAVAKLRQFFLATWRANREHSHRTKRHVLHQPHRALEAHSEVTVPARLRVTAHVAHAGCGGPGNETPAGLSVTCGRGGVASL